MGYTLTLTMPETLWPGLAGLPEDNILHRWVLDARGYGGHCPDCLELDGEVRTLAEWQNSILPGSACLQCGSGCRCSLEPVLTSPTRYTIFLPYGLWNDIKRTLVFRDGSRQWRYNFTEVLYGSRRSAARPGRAPAASLPKPLGADYRYRQPVHGVD